MKERTYSFYNSVTGLLSSRRISCPPSDAIKNTPTGFVAIEGAFDSQRQRVDIETGTVVDYVPPQPSADHEWNGSTWILNATVQTRIADDRKARAEIDQLERQGVRALRELVLDGNEYARDRLAQIDSQITDLRTKIQPHE